ncbi:aldose epimerase [Paenibacillus sp. HB172176]|uniref:aldose epimerase family protein n=1 Tax=Paenibacillus sp. HB172176 TaxID=2493690 RepID=UPI001439A133|nr:aldose epimerase [Paenibacillus sp. HB172176]
MSQYEVRSYHDTYTIYELTEKETDSRVLVCPERGGIVTGCQLKGEELFYLDKATFEDKSANIRGGNPILFPICGQLENKTYEWKGHTYELANHGVARNAEWAVIGTDDTDGASLTLRVKSSAATLAAYPFVFELEFTYLLVNGELHTKQIYRNNGETRSMPFYAGFHPYFAIEGSKNIAYETDATRYVDYNDNEEKPYEGSLDMENLVESVCLLDASRPGISFKIREGVNVRLSYDAAIFKYVVIWSVKNKPFICVEPWMAKNGELNRQEELVLLEPGEELLANFVISCEV